MGFLVQDNQGEIRLEIIYRIEKGGRYEDENNRIICHRDGNEVEYDERMQQYLQDNLPPMIRWKVILTNSLLENGRKYQKKPSAEK